MLVQFYIGIGKFQYLLLVMRILLDAPSKLFNLFF
jgi:hypothetical protein